MASLLLIVSCLSLPQIRRPGRVASSKLDGEYPSPDAFLATTAMCGYLRASLPLQALLLLRPLLPRAPRLLSNLLLLRPLLPRAPLLLSNLLLLRPLLPRAPRLLSNSSLSLAVGSKLVVGAVGRRGAARVKVPVLGRRPWTRWGRLVVAHRGAHAPMAMTLCYS
jgi:hypothetical protein